MAAAAREKYANVHFDICYCSPLVRAKETAEIVLAGRNIPIIEDDRLKEMSFGVYEGTEDCFKIPDCPLNILFNEPEKYTTPVEGGESFDDLYKRTGEFIRETADPLLREGKDILIVGHGAMNLSIICQLKKIPLEKFWSVGIENCRLMKVV
jgi:probable phosphoglycerate mutase